MNLNASCLQNDSFLGTFKSQNLTGVPGHYVNLLCLCQRVLEPTVTKQVSPTGITCSGQRKTRSQEKTRRTFWLKVAIDSEQSSGTRETLVISTYSTVQVKRPVFGSPAAQHTSLPLLPLPTPQPPTPVLVPG